MPAEKMIIGSMNAGSPAQAGGLREGDEILAVNGRAVYSTAQLSDDYISKSGGQPLVFTVNRQGQKVDLTVHPVPVPLTAPLATITVPGAADATASLDILPIYKVGRDRRPRGARHARAKTPRVEFGQPRRRVWQSAPRRLSAQSQRPGRRLRATGGGRVPSHARRAGAERWCSTAKARTKRIRRAPGDYSPPWSRRRP